MHPRAATVTIAIPTFNRGPKLERVVREFQRQIELSGEASRVQILISDNHSDRDPAVLIGPLLAGAVRTHFVRQPSNIGAERNLLFLWEQAASDYLWFFSDDDMPLEGAVTRVLSVLDSHAPDTLLFGFKQPPDLAVSQFTYRESPYVTSDGREIAAQLMHYGKMSIYVIRKVAIDASRQRSLDEQVGAGWIFMGIALTVMDIVPTPRLAILSEFLARADHEWHALEWTPLAWLYMHRPAELPFARRYHPALAGEKWLHGIQGAIGLSFLAKTGIYHVRDMDSYDKFIRDLKWQPRALLRRPRTALQFLVLKARLTVLLVPLMRWRSQRAAARLRKPVVSAR